MLVIILLISISLSIALIFLGAFVWNVKSGQYDDTYGPSVRMLFEDKKGDNESAPGERDQPDAHSKSEKTNF